MDWIIEVMKIYQHQDKTIFRAFDLIDRFLEKCPQKIKAKNFHLLGTVCLMIASKSEEVSFIHVEQVIKNITYNKFSKEEIIETQLAVLQILDYRVNEPTLFELCNCAFRLFKNFTKEQN